MFSDAMSDSIFGLTNDRNMRFLEKALDGSARRHEVMTNNIANVDTPNFKRSDIPFEEELKRAMESSSTISVQTTNPKHMSLQSSDEPSFVVVQSNDLTMRKDGNNVDIDKEMTEMAKNNVYYNAYLQMLTSKLTMLKYAIQEGK